MNNKIKTILMAAIMSSVVLTQGVCVSAAQFDDGASAFSDGTGSVSALASTLAKQTEEQTQELQYIPDKFLRIQPLQYVSFPPVVHCCGKELPDSHP